MKVSIIPWIVRKLKLCFALVEDGDTASQNIAQGKFVIWKGVCCKAASAITAGETLSGTNLPAISSGALNDISGSIPAVVNNLTSDSTTSALSAAQGKALNGNLGSPSSASSVTGADAFSKINTLNSNITTVTDLSSSISDIPSGLSLFSGRLYKNGKICLLSALLLAGSSNVTISTYSIILKMDASVKANENTDFIALIDGTNPVRPYVTKYLDNSKAYISTANSITVPANKGMLLYAVWFSA